MFGTQITRYESKRQHQPTQTDLDIAPAETAAGKKPSGMRSLLHLLCRDIEIVVYSGYTYLYPGTALSIHRFDKDHIRHYLVDYKNRYSHQTQHVHAQRISTARLYRPRITNHYTR